MVGQYRPTESLVQIKVSPGLAEKLGMTIRILCSEPDEDGQRKQRHAQVRVGVGRQVGLELTLILA
jgi:hypothetical protein